MSNNIILRKGNQPNIFLNSKNQLGIVNGTIRFYSSNPKNNLGMSKVSSQRWILDSGATDHIISSSSMLTHSKKNHSLPPVLLPSGEKAQIASTGSVLLNSHYYLDNVLYIPNFKVDLLSISRLTRGLNCSVTFSPYWCILQDLVSRKTIGLGKERNGLYYLVALTTGKTKPKSHQSSTIQPSCHLTTSTSNLWHRRLGHVSSRPLDYIAKHFLDISIPSDSNHACDICPLAKQSCLSFGIRAGYPRPRVKP
ncbi:hypothetical protein ACLB2K_043480 [Fragaria x ananassa]